jgi:hypothetical protein
MGFEHPADAPTADGVALGLYFDAQSPRAVTLAVVGKRFAYRCLPDRLGRRRHA